MSPEANYWASGTGSGSINWDTTTATTYTANVDWADIRNQWETVANRGSYSNQDYLKYCFTIY